MCCTSAKCSLRISDYICDDSYLETVKSNLNADGEMAVTDIS